MKYIFIFIGAIMLTLLDIIYFSIAFILNICWGFTLIHWKEEFSNHGIKPCFHTDNHGYPIISNEPTILKYDSNIYDTFKRHLMFQSIEEYYK